MRKAIYLFLLAALVSLTLAAYADEGSAGTWTGEIIDVACYVSHGDGGRGPDHAKCAKGCIKGGQPMGLLTDDGTLYILAADHANGAPFEAAKELAGEMAEIQGTASEKSGVKMVTVTGAKKAG